MSWLTVPKNDAIERLLQFMIQTKPQKDDNNGTAHLYCFIHTLTEVQEVEGVFSIMDNTGKCETAAFCITNGFRVWPCGMSLCLILCWLHRLPQFPPHSLRHYPSSHENAGMTNSACTLYYTVRVQSKFDFITLS